MYLACTCAHARVARVRVSVCVCGRASLTVPMWNAIIPVNTLMMTALAAVALDVCTHANYQNHAQPEIANLSEY